MNFKPMLAASEIPKAEDISFPCMASFKLDGIRCPIIDGVAMSRKLLPLPNKHFQQWVKTNESFLSGIDCEVIVGSPTAPGVFNTTQSGIMSWDGEPDFKIYVFDIWSAEGSTAQARIDMLADWMQHKGPMSSDKIVILEQRLVQSIAELNQMMTEAMDAGYEGLILKSPDNLYKFGRSTVGEGTLLKWKEFQDREARILFVHEGQTNNNPAMKDALGNTKRSTAKAGKVNNGHCGGFRVYDELYGEFDVGPGVLTKPQSKAMFDNRQKVIGEFLTYKFQPYGSLGYPRFPQYKGLRDLIDMGEPE
jgi:DNA ligase-1